ncbi:hypothetical protein GCM10027051_33020 [Niabella terrae]
MVVSPDAKSWVLQQLMHTGIFNPKFETSSPDPAGQSVMDFDFKTAQGDIQNLSSLRGKVVFINFWASWCPPCRAEFPAIESVYSGLKDHPDVFFLMINQDDDLTAAHHFLEKEHYSIPFYKTNGPVPPEIYSGTLPTTVVLDKRGRIRFHHEGLANYGAEKFLEQIEVLMNE